MQMHVEVAHRSVGTDDLREDIMGDPAMPLDCIPEGVTRRTWEQALAMVFVASKEIQDEGRSLTSELVYQWCEDWLGAAMTAWEEDGILEFHG
mmetsp:Transcript_57783/g.174712  ORF Transcript_57783/g.174712 Transcript_57783/m.174712 type:complete len:93 (-) Transcript_57783:201-479(-)